MANNVCVQTQWMNKQNNDISIDTFFSAPELRLSFDNTASTTWNTGMNKHIHSPETPYSISSIQFWVEHVSSIIINKCGFSKS